MAGFDNTLIIFQNQMNILCRFLLFIISEARKLCKGSESKCFQTCRPSHLCHSYLTLLLQHESNHKLLTSFNKNLFMDTGICMLHKFYVSNYYYFDFSPLFKNLKAIVSSWAIQKYSVGGLHLVYRSQFADLFPRLSHSKTTDIQIDRGRDIQI